MREIVDDLTNDETIDGIVERIVFHNPQNGWTVLRLQDDQSPLLKTVVGKLQQLSPGEKVRFTGRWTVDAKHGRQFSAETCVPLAPATVRGIEKYLGSGLVPGLGPVMAGRIVEKCGIDTLEILKHQPVRLAEVEEPPRQLVLGSAALEMARVVDQERAASDERWRELSLSTDFEGASAATEAVR